MLFIYIYEIRNRNRNTKIKRKNVLNFKIIFVIFSIFNRFTYVTAIFLSFFMHGVYFFGLLVKFSVCVKLSYDIDILLDSFF